MSLKQIIKTKICLDIMTPNYPLGEFVQWAEPIDKHALLRYLDTIQQELEEEQRALKCNDFSHEQHTFQALHKYWCFYCEQIRKYYKAILRDPCCESDLSFLLVNPLSDKP